jgi:hypothetical protein
MNPNQKELREDKPDLITVTEQPTPNPIIKPPPGHTTTITPADQINTVVGGDLGDAINDGAFSGLLLLMIACIGSYLAVIQTLKTPLFIGLVQYILGLRQSQSDVAKIQVQLIEHQRTLDQILDTVHDIERDLDNHCSNQFKEQLNIITQSIERIKNQ